MELIYGFYSYYIEMAQTNNLNSIRVNQYLMDINKPLAKNTNYELYQGFDTTTGAKVAIKSIKINP